MTNKKENIFAFILLFAILIGGPFVFASAKVFARFLIGLALGYVLTRTAYGFAGSVNRAYRAGSTKLMRSLMLLFTAISFVTAAIFFNGVPEGFKMAIYPINFALLIGALMFGIGMAFNSCCASGTITDMVYEPSKAIITFFFFSMGIFAAFPLQKKTDFVKKSLFVSAEGRKGVFLPDLFKFDGFNGFLVSLLITIVIAALVSYIAKKYEEKRIKEGTYNPLPDEVNQSKPLEPLSNDVKMFSGEVYYRYFARPWNMVEGVFAFTIVIAALMMIAGRGWGVTTAMGEFFGNFLHLLGVPAETLAEYAGYKPEDAVKFTQTVFQNGGRAQNLGILLGTVLMSLFAGNFVASLKGGLKISFKDGLIFVVGALLMGVGTRLANGCNAGALLTPITQFSLSGWVFFVFMVLGGILGNMIRKRII